MFGIPITTIRNIIFFALGFAFGNVLVPHNAFANPLSTVYNETSYIANCEDTTLSMDLPHTVLIYGEIGSDYENIPLELFCGDTFTINDSFIASTYYWIEYGQVFDGNQYNQTVGSDVTFSLLPGLQPGNSYTPPHFSLIKENENMLASVGGSITDGVQETGKAIWPMFAFLGVLIAFIIALQVAVFTKKTVGGNAGGKNVKAKQISDEYGPDHPDHKAYKRGRSIIEKEHPGFYDE